MSTYRQSGAPFLLVWLRGGAILLLALHLLAGRLPERVAWGLYPYTYLPTPLRWLLALLALALILTPNLAVALRLLLAPSRHLLRPLHLTNQRISETADCTDGTGYTDGVLRKSGKPVKSAESVVGESAEPNPKSAIRNPQSEILHSPLAIGHSLTANCYLLTAICSLIAWPLFYLFRIVHTRWGDAYILSKGIAHPDPALRIRSTWQAPLDVLYHSELWRLLHAPLGWEDAMPVYHLVSPTLGVAFVAITLTFADAWGRNRTEKWIFTGTLLTLGLVQFFFGYVENYVTITVTLLLYACLSWRYLHGRGSLWKISLVLALTHALHPSTIAIAPTLLYLARRGMRNPRHRLRLPRALAEVALPMVLVATLVVALMTAIGHGLPYLLGEDAPGGGDRRWFVPLWDTQTRWEHYTMFSLAHLIDIVNEALLVAPMVTLLALGLLLQPLTRSLPTLGRLWQACRAIARPLTDRLTLRAADRPPHPEIRNRGAHQRISPSANSPFAVGHSPLAPPSAIRHSPFPIRNPKSEIPNPQSPISNIRYPISNIHYLLWSALAASLYLLFTWTWNPDYGGQRDWDLFAPAYLFLALFTLEALRLVLPRREELARAGLAIIAVQAIHTLAWVYQNTLPWEWPTR